MGSVKRTHRNARLWQMMRKYLRRLNQYLARYGMEAVVSKISGGDDD